MAHEPDNKMRGAADKSREHSNQTDSNETPSEVGYKRPPIGSRFKKGLSGHRKGRPTGGRNFAMLFDEVLAETIGVREGGRVRRISKAEALANVALQAAIKGDARAISAFLLLADKTQLLTPEEVSETGRYGYLVVPEVATPEEWQKEAREALRVQTQGQGMAESGQKPQRKVHIYVDPVTEKVTVVPYD